MRAKKCRTFQKQINLEPVYCQDNDGVMDFNELVKMFTGADSIRELITGETEEEEEKVEEEEEEDVED